MHRHKYHRALAAAGVAAGLAIAPFSAFAAWEPTKPVEIVVAADGCLDDTASIAESVWPGCVILGDGGGAGRARAAARQRRSQAWLRADDGSATRRRGRRSRPWARVRC